MDMNDLIENAESTIRRAGMTVEEFCGLVGVHRATWQRWKAGKTSPKLADWQRVEAELARISEAA